MNNTNYELRKLMHSYLDMQEELTKGMTEAEQNKDVDAHLCAKAMKKQCRTMITGLWKVMVKTGALDEEEIEFGSIKK